MCWSSPSCIVRIIVGLKLDNEHAPGASEERGKRGEGWQGDELAGFRHCRACYVFSGGLRARLLAGGNWCSPVF